MARKLDDSAAMARAIELSLRGFPAPNPRVGCLLVRDGEVVGEGWHEFAGAPHAEAMALAEAGDRARQSTAYVTLEPCNHFGRTPPCSQALMGAGVSRVVVACSDPNPVAAGGLKALEQAGVRVEFGLMAKEAAEANWRFLRAHQLGRPAVVAKCAMSADGRIALPSGESKWITCEASREEGHRLRAEMGAVLVGRATVEADDPELTARVPGVRNPPLRVVLDPSGRLDVRKYKVFDDQAETLHATLAIFPGAGGRLNLNGLLQALWAKGVTGLLVEGGGFTIARFLEAGLVDRLQLFVAPKLLMAGVPAISGDPPPSLAEARQGRWNKPRQMGEDLWLELDLRE